MEVGKKQKSGEKPSINWSYTMKKIMFLTGTRADFGHQKPLIDKCIENGFDVSIFITGMHLDEKYGKTIVRLQN